MSKFKISLSLMGFIILLIVGVYKVESCRDRKQSRQTRQQAQTIDQQSQGLLKQIKTYEHQMDSLRYRRDSVITELFFLSDAGIQGQLDSLFNAPGYVLP